MTCAAVPYRFVRDLQRESRSSRRTLLFCQAFVGDRTLCQGRPTPARFHSKPHFRSHVFNPNASSISNAAPSGFHARDEAWIMFQLIIEPVVRSEERRVGKECR